MIETKWDYLFYLYKANLPLDKNYRSDLDKLHKAVNTIIETELKEKQGALKELKRLLNLKGYDSVPFRMIEERIKELEEGVEK